MTELVDLKRRLKALEVRVTELEKGKGRPPLHVLKVREWLEAYLKKSKRADKKLDPRYLYAATDAEGFTRSIVRKAAKQLGWVYYEKYWHTEGL